MSDPEQFRVRPEMAKRDPSALRSMATFPSSPDSGFDVQREAEKLFKASLLPPGVTCPLE